VSVPGQWIVNASILAEAFPVAAAVATRTRDPARRWIAVAFASWVVQDLALWWTAVRHLNNHWIIHIGNPITTVLFLLAYVWWMEDSVRQRALQIAAGAYVVVWGILFLTVENVGTFSQYTGPLQALVLMLVCAYAVVRAVGTGTAPVWQRDVFWVSIGLLLDFGTGLLLTPVSGMLAQAHPSLVLHALAGKDAINVLAYLLVTIGMLCPPSPSSIGVFSSRLVSPS
jgi:hypothetical protein